jgi:hypothetical protein
MVHSEFIVSESPEIELPGSVVEDPVALGNCTGWLWRLGFDEELWNSDCCEGACDDDVLASEELGYCVLWLLASDANRYDTPGYGVTDARGPRPWVEWGNEEGPRILEILLYTSDTTSRSESTVSW